MADLPTNISILTNMLGTSKQNNSILSSIFNKNMITIRLSSYCNSAVVTKLTFFLQLFTAVTGFCKWCVTCIDGRSKTHLVQTKSETYLSYKHS